jgi:hypothetical protein
VPPLIRDVFELLACEEEDALVHLAAIRTLGGWLGGRERLSLAAARAQEYTWEEIGAAQGRPRQALQRQASRQAQRPPVLGLTAPDFVGVASAELEFWLRWVGRGRLVACGARGGEPRAQARAGADPRRAAGARAPRRPRRRALDELVARREGRTSRPRRAWLRACSGGGGVLPTEPQDPRPVADAG